MIPTLLRVARDFVAPDRHPLPPPPRTVEEFRERQQDLVDALQARGAWHMRLSGFNWALTCLSITSLIILGCGWITDNAIAVYVGAVNNVTTLLFMMFSKRLVR